ncbi:MAG: polyphosphate kinase 2 family protein [Anaerolineae bacterium]|nr:polyphosphate kinase 2 family protein [Anaerolineae bacterium]NUQ02280.1 polyphosphate kinase 2 family protein [Anaerolineae bacterium]
MADQPLTPPFGKKVRLEDYDPSFTNGMSKDDAKAREKKLEARMGELQEMLYAQGTQSLLVVLQAMDAGGKDGAIKHVFDAVNPQGVRVTSFKQPTPEELAHDFLWRVHPHVPPKGYIGIFNRSHYEDVLVVRVNQLVPQDVWEQRYDHINAFERLVVERGTRVLKFFLHISRDEQKRRFQERLDDPSKQWKFSTGDLPVREKWDDYMKAYEAVLTRCHTEAAPWHIIAANKKWYRDLVITQSIVQALEAMDVRYPDPEPGLESVVIPD